MSRKGMKFYDGYSQYAGRAESTSGGDGGGCGIFGFPILLAFVVCCYGSCSGGVSMSASQFLATWFMGSVFFVFLFGTLGAGAERASDNIERHARRRK